MNASVRALLRPYLPPASVEASFAVMGLDTRLVADGTYFVVEHAGRIAGCGGWSRRRTLFGGDHSGGRDDALLDPSREPARVRAMYTHPDFARRGVGRRVLALCEAAAAAEGFRAVTLVATLAGEPLYAACGYAVDERFLSDPVGDVRVPLVRMSKALAADGDRTG